MPKINELTLGELKELKIFLSEKTDEQSNIGSCMLGKYCVVRTYSAGVHVGYVKEISQGQVLLENARRIWKWSGAFTLSELAEKGISKQGSRVTIPVKEILLTEAIEIIPLTQESKEKIDTCDSDGN